MTNKINNQPDYAKKYAYVVARKFRGEWWFWGAYNDSNRAEKIAFELQSLHNEVAIFHNIHTK